MITERVRIATPEQRDPKTIVDTLAKLVEPLTGYARVSVGFPGVVRRGKIMTAHNLGQEAWLGFDLDLALAEKLGKPVRVLNDADIQGLGAISGKGVEMVITLGTGLGSSLAEDGRLSCHLELAHHPARSSRQTPLEQTRRKGHRHPPSPDEFRPSLHRRRQCESPQIRTPERRPTRVERTRDARRYLALERTRPREHRHLPPELNTPAIPPSLGHPALCLADRPALCHTTVPHEPGPAKTKVACKKSAHRARLHRR